MTVDLARPDPPESALHRAVDEARDELVGLCARLVAARSVNPPGDTRDVARVVCDHLASRGIAADLVSEAPTMPNVLASVQGDGAGPHLVLNVHLDTMDPGNEDAWSVPIYELTRRDGRLSGLGMGNMKGAVAAMVVAYRLLHERRDSWCGRLTFTAVSDECVFGEHGASFLLRSIPEQVVGDALICGEGPGSMRLALAEKGVAWYSVTATGAAGHASRARAGSTASVRLAAVLLALDRLNDVVVAPPPGLASVPASDAEAFRLSVNAGVLSGGTFISSLPTSVTAQIDARLPPGMSLDDFEARVSAVLVDHPDVTITRVKAWAGNWSGLAEGFVATFAGAARDVRGREPAATVRLPASDASRWRRLGVPAVCYGPQPTLSAGIDDYAEERDVIDCAKVYATAAARYLRRS